MKASLRAAWMGGVVVVLSLVLGASPGSTQGMATAPAATPPPAAPPTVSAPPDATAPAASATPAAAPATPATAFESAAAKADPDCKVADVSCAWSHCNPLPGKWSSYHGCLTDSCKVTDQACMGDLIMDLSDPDRQRSNGQK
jgi:hypothetical protein